MKRFLLALIAALALPTAVNAGDLGVADFSEDQLGSRYRSEKFEAMANNNSFNWYCGGFKLGYKDCVVEFKNGQLIVNGSKGIKPSQVKFFNYNSEANIENLNSLSIFYVDSKGQFTSAGFFSKGDRESISFHRRFLKWMNTSK